MTDQTPLKTGVSLDELMRPENEWVEVSKGRLVLLGDNTLTLLNSLVACQRDVERQPPAQPRRKVEHEG